MSEPDLLDRTSNDAMPIAAVAFDFDGTLADTRHAVVATAQQTLQDFDIAPLEPDAIATRMGLPLVEVFVAAGVESARLDAAVQRYRQRFFDNAARVALFPGVLGCLQALATAGLPTGIVSSRGRGSLLALLDQLGIRSFFCEVLGDEDAVQKKPAPDLVLALAKRMRLPAARLLVVGDTTFDIEMGNAAGSRTCGVTYGSHDAARLRGAKPHHLLDSLSGLDGLLARFPLQQLHRE